VNNQAVADVESIPVVKSVCDASRDGERGDLRRVSYAAKREPILLIGEALKRELCDGELPLSQFDQTVEHGEKRAQRKSCLRSKSSFSGNLVAVKLLSTGRNLQYKKRLKPPEERLEAHGCDFTQFLAASALKSLPQKSSI
jgi:hypothetical protein